MRVDPDFAPRPAMLVQTLALGKRFGGLTALEDVSIEVRPGTVHALLGENGAGKTTLVKCLAGSHTPDEGAVLCDGREQFIANPVIARELGIGMVYQHFTLAPGMTVAENLLLARGKLPAWIRWNRQREQIEAFLRATPFRMELDARPADMAAGQKQKLELLKQLYLRPRLLILDEPTSVLTPQEADEVLSHVRAIAHSGHCTVLLITHKFREVMAYADDVTVLRRGKAVHFSAVSSATPQALARAMIGSDQPQAADESPGMRHRGGVDLAPAERRDPAPAERRDPAPALEIRDLCVHGDRGTLAVVSLSLAVRAGEILGVAGVSGNGQRELMEAIVGQRRRASGSVQVQGMPYVASRAQNHILKLRSLPEEPLRNGCVAGMSVSDNMALRDFDRAPLSRRGWLRSGVWRRRARAWITEYGIKSQGEGAPVSSLSGGNVQRVVLARELAGDIRVLIAMNPVFGLDFAAVREIHARIVEVRSQGGAVLLISEDIDELLELADRIVVMSEGRLVHETLGRGAQRQVLGAYMGGAGFPDQRCGPGPG
ncbi:MAG: ABC transporter ATP-binding protein [Betaproteobacteria bacterium]|nr:ABC transporter ATP-binding protein [Betaproteobacteria bacterium]